MLKRFSAVLVAAALGLTACDDAGTGLDTDTDTAPVAIRFGTLRPVTPADGPAGSTATAAQGVDEPLVVTGTNGTLTIEDIRLIVAEFELEAEEGDCDTPAEQTEDEDGDDDSACPDFEAPPAFVDLPLAGSAVAVATDRVPVGTYTKLEFAVEDVDFDEEDEDEEELSALRAEIEDAFPDWPDEASMVVTGTFTPDGGAAQPFTTFFDAEIEVEQVFATPLTVTNTGATRAITIEIAPNRWFLREDGTVTDLADHDYEATGELVELEVEFEEGIQTYTDYEDGEEEDEEEND